MFNQNDDLNMWIDQLDHKRIFACAVTIGAITEVYHFSSEGSRNDFKQKLTETFPQATFIDGVQVD